MLTIRTNLSNNASSQYNNFDFNSMCRFNGFTLAAGDAGLFKVNSGDLDGTTEISAHFVPVKTNFGSLNKKRERHVYLAGECDGSMQVEVIGDSATIGPYEVAFQSSEGQQRRRVKVGGGMDFSYASHKISNVNGSDFSMDVIEAYLDIKPYGGN